MKKLLLLILLTIFIAPFSLSAEQPRKDEIFKAKVIEIVAQKQKISPEGKINLQQDLKLVGLEGKFKNKEIKFNGIGELDVLNKQIYQIGDKVIMAASYDADNKATYYIVDYARIGKLWFLAGLFLFTLLVVGRIKGLRSAIALGLTFIIIIKYIIPQILSGANPLFVTLLGSFLILLAIIYTTEGFCPRSHIAIISILISLCITILLAQFFVSLTRLTGAANEEILFLFNIKGAAINLRGLLLAGIIIGTLGVLDDVVISQTATAEEIAKTDAYLNAKEIFKKTYNVGVSHIASMTNTLFLAYAGMSLPLLILFVSGQSAFASWPQALNTELIATEIVRALGGSIGLILSVPITTLIAARWFSKHR